MNILTAIIGAITLFLGLAINVGGIIVLMTLINAFVFMKLWLWFVVPFFGLPPLIIPVAIGLSMVMSFLTNQVGNAKEEDDPGKVSRNTGMGIMRPFVYLLMGYIVHFYMPTDIKPFFNHNPAPIVQAAQTHIVEK